MTRIFVALLLGVVAGVAVVGMGMLGGGRSALLAKAGARGLVEEKQALQARLLSLRQEHRQLLGRKEALATRKAALPSGLEAMVDHAERDFLKYEKGNPYFDKSAEFSLQDDQDDDGDSADDGGGGTQSKAASPGAGDGGGETGRKEAKPDAIVQLEGQFGEYQRAWDRLKTVHPRFGAGAEPSGGWGGLTSLQGGLGAFGWGGKIRNFGHPFELDIGIGDEFGSHQRQQEQKGAKLG